MARIRSKGGAAQRISSSNTLPSLRKRLRNVDGSVADEVRKAMAISIIATMNRVKRNLVSGSRSGKIYTAGRSKPHRASAPGEPPHSDFGSLVRGIIHEIDQDGLGGAVLSTVNYSKYLEFGTLRGGKKGMAPRPFLFPASEEERAKSRARIIKALRLGVKKGAKS